MGERLQLAVKRALDPVAALGLVVLFFPVLAAISLWILAESGRPVLFVRPRAGKDGRPFRMFKFRTMVPNAIELGRELRLSDDPFGLVSADPRITRSGRFLRRTGLDELPQLLNVLRGEMSLVGPRPLVTDEDALIMGLDRSRLHLTPGMTGPWQVLGARVPMREMVGLDYLYVANWSLWSDIKILLRTVQHVVGGHNR